MKPQSSILLGKFWVHFWGSFWGPKLLQYGTKHGTTFGTPLLRISGVYELRFREINESGEIPISPRIILSKKGWDGMGLIMLYEAL